MTLAAERLAATEPARSFFYSSGRSSNEAGFVLQLLARLYGTNNVNNCSYYCHQATSVGAGNTIGKGTATVELADLGGCDLIFVIGANPASNHPRFIHHAQALPRPRRRGGDRQSGAGAGPGALRRAQEPDSMLTGGTEIASRLPAAADRHRHRAAQGPCQGRAGPRRRGPRPSSHAHTTGFASLRRRRGGDELAGDLRANLRLAQQDIERVADALHGRRHVVFAWGMGMTHHLHGVANVEADRQSGAAARHDRPPLRRPAAAARPLQRAGHRHHRRQAGAVRGRVRANGADVRRHPASGRGHGHHGGHAGRRTPARSTRR